MSRREEQRRRTRKQTLAPTITFLPFYHIYPEVNSDPLPFVWAVCTLPPAFKVCIHCTIFSTKRRLATHTTFHPTYSSISPIKAPLRAVKSMLNLLLSGSLLVAWSPRVLLSFAARKSRLEDLRTLPCSDPPPSMASAFRSALSLLVHCALVYTLLAPPAHSLLFIQ